MSQYRKYRRNIANEVRQIHSLAYNKRLLYAKEYSSLSKAAYFISGNRNVFTQKP